MIKPKNNFKAVISIILLFLVHTFANAQYFTATPDGLRNSTNMKEKFVVIEIPDLSAAELYTGALNYITKTYKVPEKVIKGSIKNEYLRFDTHFPQITKIRSIPPINYDANYTTEIEFKDGKIKISIIELELVAVTSNAKLHFSDQGPFTGWYLYNKKGVLKQPKTKAEIEAYFDIKLSYIVDFLKGEGAFTNDW